jgi:hypothetical protein
MTGHTFVGKYSKRFRCLVNNPCEDCKWFELYDKPFTIGELVHIGWCSRFEPDPDAGYVAQKRNPPCLVWGYEKAGRLV